MNCHDIANLLDSREVLELTETQQGAVSTHLRECGRCEAEWRAVRALPSSSVNERERKLPTTNFERPHDG